MISCECVLHDTLIGGVTLCRKIHMKKQAQTTHFVSGCMSSELS